MQQAWQALLNVNLSEHNLQLQLANQQAVQTQYISALKQLTLRRN